jgi:hypothetical protein
MKVQTAKEETVVGRLANLRSYNIVAHHDGGTTHTATKPPLPDFTVYVARTDEEQTTAGEVE